MSYQKNKSKRTYCRCCPLRQQCLPATAKTRTILIVDGYESLLRTRRRRQKGWDDKTKQLYNRHRNLVEGVHGEAKTQHGLRSAVRRGLVNVAIQVYLTAAVMNLKRLAIASIRPFHHCFFITKCLAAYINKILSSFGKKYTFLRRASYGAA